MGGLTAECSTIAQHVAGSLPVSAFGGTGGGTALGNALAQRSRSGVDEIARADRELRDMADALVRSADSYQAQDRSIAAGFGALTNRMSRGATGQW